MALLALGLTFVAVIQLVCLFALVDQYKSLLQIRDALRLVDTPSDLPLFDLDGILPSSAGLPAALDAEPFAVVLLLSTKCSTCRAVARAMDRRVPAHSWAVIEGRSENECREFLLEVGLSDEQVLMDVGGRVAERLRTKIFPTAIVYSNGVARSARTVPSYRQFRQLLNKREESYSAAT